MPLAIDVSRANRGQRTGVEWFVFFVTDGLKKIVPPETEVVLYSETPLAGDLSKLPPRWRSRVLRWPPKKFWTVCRLSWEMLWHKPEALLIPAHVPPFFAPPRTIMVIHDIGHLRFPAAYSWFERWYADWTIKRAKKNAWQIIAISEFTKKELMEVYGFYAEKIAVVPLAADQKFNRPKILLEKIAAVKKRYGLDGAPYFLYVGRLEKKKNTAFLIRAFDEFKKMGGALRLVLVGKPGFGYEETVVAIDASPNQKDIIELGYVQADDLAALYAAAAAFLFPSLYEGFGIPVLEAFGSGTPVIASTSGAIPEVTGNAAILLPPDDLLAWVGAMQKILDPSLATALREKGRERAAAFSWEKTARGILAETYVGRIHNL
ncbi:MAG: group 1 glycosyl transferase [Candidatus Magasanikbacteria bacterium]|nr:group 1 glycosyl transferase [Candidatus Magasanikbacteria bacterium]